MVLSSPPKRIRGDSWLRWPWAADMAIGPTFAQLGIDYPVMKRKTIYFHFSVSSHVSYIIWVSFFKLCVRVCIPVFICMWMQTEAPPRGQRTFSGVGSHLSYRSQRSNLSNEACSKCLYPISHLSSDLFFVWICGTQWEVPFFKIETPFGCVVFVAGTQL